MDLSLHNTLYKSHFPWLFTFNKTISEKTSTRLLRNSSPLKTCSADLFLLVCLILFSGPHKSCVINLLKLRIVPLLLIFSSGQRKPRDCAAKALLWKASQLAPSSCAHLCSYKVVNTIRGFVVHFPFRCRLWTKKSAISDMTSRYNRNTWLCVLTALIPLDCTMALKSHEMLCSTITKSSC